MDSDNEKTYTVQEIAEILKSSQPKIYRLIDSGKLKAFNTSPGNERNNWRITSNMLNEFIESQQTNG